MRGRKPKPTSNQIAAGDPRKLGKRKLEAKLATEPKAARGLPACPRHLRGRARAAWNFWREELAAMSLDRRPDAMMLEGTCMAYEAAARAYESCAELGDVVKEPIMSRETGEVLGYRLKKNPWVSVRERSLLLVKAFCSEFGLSPVSRTRLAIEKRDDSQADLMAVLTAAGEARRARRETIN